MLKNTFLFLSVSFGLALNAQNDNQNGDWSKRFVQLDNTSEADYMIRYGDIDNLGFGWEKNFNPFSGKSTPSHDWPMEKKDSTEINGFDMVMIGSSFKNSDMSRDGYCGAKDYLIENFGNTTFEFKISLHNIDTSKINNVTLQFFVDDFQPKEFGSKFELYINNKPATFAYKTLNSLAQTGPIGKLITIDVPSTFVSEFKKNEVTFLFDDKTSGIGDGFAIDFIKILINKKTIKTAPIKGIVKGANDKAVIGAKVVCNGQTIVSDAKGQFTFKAIPLGLALISVTEKNGKEMDFNIDVEEGAENNFELHLNY